MYGRFLCAGALAIASLIAVAVHDASYGKSKMTLVHDKALPNVPGKSIRTVLVEYGPGGFRLRMPTRAPPSFTRRSCRDRSGPRSTVGRCSPVAPLKASPSLPATVTA